jgi:endo-alpha-1,4-polygalactosaminidase (GH114 family)
MTWSPYVSPSAITKASVRDLAGDLGLDIRVPQDGRWPLGVHVDDFLRQLMREMVIALSDYCKKRRADMIIMVRNAPELLLKEQREADWLAARDPGGAGRYSAIGSVDGPYLAAIDGMLIDGLYYGHERYDLATRADEAKLLSDCVEVLSKQGRRCLTIEYCKDGKFRADAQSKADKAHLISYIDGDGDKLLNQMPSGPPATENPNHVNDLSAARNFLPLLSSTGFGRRDLWINALSGTNHDLLMIDPFWRGSSMTIQEMRALKLKRLGSQRLVFATLPVGYAAVDRFYWQRNWHTGVPEFLAAADPDDTSHFFTYYWRDSWKQVIGNYVTGLCDLGVDGVILDGLEAYRWFEAMMPF